MRVIIDSNILVLLIIGTWDRNSIPQHRRTKVYTPRDFDLLQTELRRYQRVITTPSVLTEASNLMGNDFHEAVSRSLIDVCTPFVEVVQPKDEVFAKDVFP